MQHLFAIFAYTCSVYCHIMSFDILCEIARDEESATIFLQERQCLRRTAPNCIICNRAMTWVKIGVVGKHVWRCPSHKGQKVHPRIGSFWENSRLPLAKLLQLAFFWSYSIPNKTCQDFTGVQSQAIVQWYQHFRDVCSHHLLQNPIRIGGPNTVVKLDVSVLPRRKRKMNHPVSDRWVFGGICPDTQEGFLVFVPDREPKTLFPIIEQHVCPGSIIHTNGQASYNGIARINVKPPYTHKTIKHRVDSVDPVTGASTNPVEKHLQKARQKFKAMCGVQGTVIESYLDEFLWRERYGKEGIDAFENLLQHISHWHPIP